MTAKHSHREETSAESVRRAEQARHRTRRTRDGGLKDPGLSDPVLSDQGPSDPGLSGAELSDPRHSAPGDVRSVVMHLTARVDELTGELDRARRQVAELETAADEDTLLPVLNRRGFVRELGRSIAFIERYDTPAALVYLHVDDLKAVNGAYGYAAGDAILCDIASRVRDNLRASDIVGHLGGGAIGAVLWSAAQSDAVRKAEALAAAISSEPSVFGGLRIAVAVSGGATALNSTDSTESAVKRASSAIEPVTPGGA